MPAATFHVAHTADFYDAAGKLKFKDIGTEVLAAQPHIQTSLLAEHRPHLDAEQIRQANGVVVLTPQVTARTFEGNPDLLAIGRFGVGYDSVDVAACTQADVLIYITAGAVNRSVAEATIGWMIALCHHTMTKDRLVRQLQWNERAKFMGRDLREHTFGAVGLGGIARETLRLLAPFGMNPPIAFDPFVTPAAARELGVEMVSLPELMRRADFVSIHCPLSPETRNLIGARELALMKPEAFLINTARGGIVNEAALYEALKNRRIAGAAIDCFDTEPVLTPHPFAELDNVLLAPHSIAWTDELFRDIGRAVCQGMVDLSQGRQPRGAINPEVFDRPGFKEKWARLRVDP
ncbi:MAG: hydroxyacid dehydrogenase [Candidatus Latescibacteria bacterium]|nr:hydroxyacid dehydrogenase [Candidatus Latescibacterota bacterium]